MTDPKQKDSVLITDELLEFLNGLTKESDRALVILGAARLDFGLECLLKSVMHHHPNGNDNLFDADRPLGTFSAKIALAHRLGLIDHDFERALQLIRKIRNKFAHSFEQVILSDSQWKNRISEIVKVVQNNKFWRTLYDYLESGVGPEIDHIRTETDFYVVIATMIVTLEIAERKNTPAMIKYPASFTWTSS